MEQASCHESDSDKSRLYWDYPTVLRTKFDKDGQIGTGLISSEPLALPEGRRYRPLDYVWPLHRYVRRRCIIPAGGFYEWRKEGRRKGPMWVYLKNRKPFALASLWDVWRKPNRKRVESFTVIMTEPNELVRPVHNRMAFFPPTGRRRAMA